MAFYFATPQQYYHLFLEHGGDTVELVGCENWNVNQYSIDEDAIATRYPKLESTGLDDEVQWTA